MNFDEIYLSRKEKRRFLAIAAGKTTASNTPDEDALFRYELVRETMIVKLGPDRCQSSADLRAVVLSDLGRKYYAQYRNQKKKDIANAWKFVLTTFIAVAALIIALLDMQG